MVPALVLPNPRQNLGDCASALQVRRGGQWLGFGSAATGGLFLGAEDASPYFLRFRSRKQTRREQWRCVQVSEHMISLQNREDPYTELKGVLSIIPDVLSAAKAWAAFLEAEARDQAVLQAALDDMLAEARRIHDDMLSELVELRREAEQWHQLRGPISHLLNDVDDDNSSFAGFDNGSGIEPSDRIADAFEGLTGVVDALRDQVKGASAEPVMMAVARRGQASRGTPRKGTEEGASTTGAGDVGTGDVVRRCKVDPNLKAPGFKGST